MRKETVKIMCAADRGFFPFVPTMLRNVIKRTSAKIEVGVVVQGVGDAAKRELRRTVPDANIQFFDVDKQALGGLYHKAALSPLSYARVLMADLVEWERFVYLDIDTLVLGDVEELYNTELGAHPFAAVFPSGKLNAGMLVINAAVWRARNLREQVLQYARVHRPKEADQAAIEAVCGDEGLHLPAEWNVVLDPVWGRIPLSMPDYYRSAKMLHFITGFKPWNLGHALLPRDLAQLWSRNYFPASIPRDVPTELRLLGWQLKTLAGEAVRRMTGSGDYTAEVQRQAP